MLTSKQKQWYAIYTRAKAEKKVHEQLKCSGYEVYLPLVTTIKQWSDRKKKVKISLISSYVFIKTQKEKLNHVLSIYGNVRILKYLGENAIVKNQEIKNLKRLLNTSYSVQLFRFDGLKESDNVKAEIPLGLVKRIKVETV